MVRILWLIWRDFTHPDHGGATVYMREVSKDLALRGHEVEVITSSYKGASREERIDGVHIRRAGNDWNIGFIVAALFLIRRMPRADVVIDEINIFPFWTPLVTRARKVALIHHLAGDVLDRYALQPWTRLGLKVLQALVLFLYRNYTTITPSAATSKELTSFGFKSKKVFYAPPGLSGPHGKDRPSTPKADNPQAIYVGRVVPQKGLEIVIRALKDVTKASPDVQLVICGKTQRSYHLRLEKLVSAVGLQANVQLLGFVSDAEKERLLAESHVFVIHSAKEGWGMAAMEAMAMGTPVIASNVPGLRDLVVDDETGWLVDYGNTVQLADRMKTVFQWVEEDSRMYWDAVRASRRRAASYQTATSVDLFERVLLGVLSSHDLG